MTGIAASLSEGSKQISDAVIGGAALSKFEAMLVAQGVTMETAQSLCSAHTDYYSILRKSEHQMELQARAQGFVLDINGLVLAQVLNKLGAGRSKAGELVNHSVGAELLVSPGQSVRTGQSWLRLHYEDPAPTPEQIDRLQKALTVGNNDNKQARVRRKLVAELMLPD